MTRRAALAAAGLALALAAAAPAQAAYPVISYALTGPAGEAGWFRGPVTVKWTVTDETTSSGCDTATFTDDTPGVERSCTASNANGPITATARIRIDQTPPVGVVPLAARPADAGTWYTAPLPITWSGTDATSGIAACTTLTYTGPDGPGMAPAGICRDKAGNDSASVPLGISYDATPPTVANLTAAPAPGQATLRWTPGPDVQRVTIARAPGDAAAPSKVVSDGPQGATELVDRGLVGGQAYTWTVTVRDAAGNAATATTSATTPPPAKAAAAGVVPGKLRWKARQGASYYNLQLLRRGSKILSTWPTKPRYTVRSSWRFRGKRRTLSPGVYAWYVWPGYGPRPQRRYGRLLAHGTFTVR